MKFWVPGQPAPKGSWTVGKTKTGRVFLRPDMRRSKPWADSVAWAAKTSAQGSLCIPGACQVDIVFHMERPKRPKHDWPRLDVDKLVRNCLDAMSGILYTDDSQVVDIHAQKCWAGEHGPGAEISVVPVWNTK